MWKVKRRIIIITICLAERTNFNLKLLKKDFENICTDLLNKLIPPIKKDLNDAN